VFGLLRGRAEHVLCRGVATAGRILRQTLAPAPGEPAGVAGGLLADLTRSKPELVAENAFLRQQLLVAARHVRKPRFRASDRILLVTVAAVLRNWRSALVLVKPETLLRWHRNLFRFLWRRKSKAKSPRGPRLTREVIALIRGMAIENRLWGAERIRGELLKLGIAVAKSTVQRSLCRFRSVPPDGQRWSTFLRNQAAGIWCCDLFEVRGLWFRCHFVFVVMHLESRRILRAVERLIGSIRRECLDCVLVHNEDHLQQLLDEFRAYSNDARPHQGLGQRRPTTASHPARTPLPSRRPYRVASLPILGGLHHDYRIAA
jgi:Zn-finger protein